MNKQIKELNQNHGRLKNYGINKANEKDLINSENEKIKLSEKNRYESEEIYKKLAKEFKEMNLKTLVMIAITMVMNMSLFGKNEFSVEFITFISVVNFLTAMILCIDFYYFLCCRKMKKSIKETGKIPKMFGFEFETNEYKLDDYKKERKKQVVKNFLRNEFVLEKEELEHHYKILGKYLTKEEITKLMREEGLDMIGRYETIDLLYCKAKEKIEKNINTFLELEEGIKKQLDILQKTKKVAGWKIPV